MGFSVKVIFIFDQSSHFCAPLTESIAGRLRLLLITFAQQVSSEQILKGNHQEACLELEMEINLGIEEILPATVKPNKTPIHDLSSDYDDDLDKLTQNNVFGE